jgi:signal transduction histidine kinase
MLDYPRTTVHSVRRWLLLPAAAWATGLAAAADLPPQIDLIGRTSRILNRKLAAKEERVAWLENRLASIAPHREHAMKVSLGARCGRIDEGDPDPSMTLDLGKVYSLEEVFLVPSQPEFMEDSGLFPLRFTVEASSREDFSERRVLFASDSSAFPPPEGKPVRFAAGGAKARFVRVTVQEGHQKGVRDVFGLSELVAISSSGDPVSFGATVTAVGALSVSGIWYPAALTDGHTPLGIWQGITPGPPSGDCVTSSSSDEAVSWTLELGEPAEVDRVVLYPYQLTELLESSVLPESFSLHISGAEGATESLAYKWETPLSGANRMTPLVIPLNGVPVKSLRFTGTRPWQLGNLRVQAVSEIEVWSAGENLAQGRPVTRWQEGEERTTITNLTDGFANGRQLIPVAQWLNQLHERRMLEHELETLRPETQRMANGSELNTTWGYATMLGIGFLIPIFLVERRRAQSRQQIEELRRRIASDLHDDIGSNLGSISLIARTARKDLVRLKGPEEVADDLGEVECIARESSLAMRDIVWLLEQKEDSIGDLVERMRETAGRLLRGIDHSIDCDSSKAGAKLSLDAKRHLFLFYKEAIHNILKHSGASRVTICLTDEQDRLVLEIVDDGRGLPAGAYGHPPKVQKLTDRASVLGGTLKIHSTPGCGTHVRLAVKRSLLTVSPTFP